MANILCVDDEPHVVTLKRAILESAGHAVTACTSARDAIEKLRHNAYDAVVTDWRLGDANGRAVVQAAKDHSSMPVVVVSGYVAEAFQAAEPLADLYLEKPVNPEELVTIVNELLKSQERDEEGQKRQGLRRRPSTGDGLRAKTRAVFFASSWDREIETPDIQSGV